MQDHGKTLETLVTDWIAAVLTTGQGWEVKRTYYRKGITTDIDPFYSWLDKSFAADGVLPPLETAKQRWPGLPWPVKPLTDGFAHVQMDDGYRRWDLIEHHRTMDRLLADGSNNEAYEHAMSFALKATTGMTAHGVSITDPSLYVDDDGLVLELPSWGPVMAGTGMGQGDILLLTARTGIGKSWLLIMAAIDGVTQGWDVVMWSLEMPARQIIKRMQLLLGENLPKWVKKQPGSMFIIDSSMSRRGYTARDLIRRIDKGSKTLAILDYGELLRPESGGRSSEGWQKSAEISQSLQQATKHLQVPVIAAVQDNRESLKGRPGTESISGSDQWGRDADFVVRLRDEAGDPAVPGPTRLLEPVKSRHTGARLNTFLNFAPGTDGIQVIDRMKYGAINERSL